MGPSAAAAAVTDANGPLEGGVSPDERASVIYVVCIIRLNWTPCLRVVRLCHIITVHPQT